MPALTDQELAERCAKASAAVSQLGSRARGRAVASVDGVQVSTWPVSQPWATQADLTTRVPDGAVLDDVLGWLGEHGRHGWTVLVREPDVNLPQLVARGLAWWSPQPVFALPSAEAAALRAESPPGVVVRRARDRAEFVTGYGAWMDDVTLAEQLVAAEDVGDPAWVHLVAVREHRPVGAAMVRYAAGTGYISALGVESAHRGAGIGTALAVAAAQVGAQGTEVTWLHATDQGARRYAALGFREVDVHVLLAPVGTPPER